MSKTSKTRFLIKFPIDSKFKIPLPNLPFLHKFIIEFLITILRCNCIDVFLYLKNQNYEN